MGPLNGSQLEHSLILTLYIIWIFFKLPHTSFTKNPLQRPSCVLLSLHSRGLLLAPLSLRSYILLQPSAGNECFVISELSLLFITRNNCCLAELFSYESQTLTADWEGLYWMLVYRRASLYWRQKLWEREKERVREKYRKEEALWPSSVYILPSLPLV